MKIYLDTIGCRLNQSEIETYARQFRAAGHVIVPEPSLADLAVINTCTVTVKAAADSRKKIRWVKRAGVEKVVVTGCWSEMEPLEAAALPGVNQLVSNLGKDNLVAEVLDLPAESFDLEPLARKPIPGARMRTRAFIKVQDGCDNRCTFCVTTLARGRGRSRSIPQILADIRAALEGGRREIVLTGVHMGSWGNDFARPKKLDELVAAILAQTATPRLRLSSLEPWDIEASFFALWEDERLARHLHLPLQSGCAATLKRMARKTTPEAYAELLDTARKLIPEVAITTDVIAGFPGESDDEFNQSLAFIETMAFARGHVFTYSERPATAAAKMPGAVPYPIRKARNAQMRAIFKQSARAYRERFSGQNLAVLWETATHLETGNWSLSGLSDNYLRVTAQSSQNLWNQISSVTITGVNAKGLIGEIES